MINSRFIDINGRRVGEGYPVYIIAEISANHNGSYEKAIQLIEHCSDAGVDAIKLQTYTPDTLTINVDTDMFMVKGENLWKNRSLYDLYSEAQTPWEWHSDLKRTANDLGLELFSSPFDPSAVDFLNELGVPAYKIASFEITDTNLIEYIASKRKPMLLSTGMATLAQIESAVKVAKSSADDENSLLLFKCVSAYPAPPESMNLNSIPYISNVFDVPVGLSDHTLGNEIPIAAVALGAVAIEKHVTLSRKDDGPDSAFSTEPAEMKKLVQQIRNVEKGLGNVFFGPTKWEKENVQFQRSLFVTEDIKSGCKFTHDNVKSIRPGYGLPPSYLDEIIGMAASEDIKKGTPMSWKLLSKKNKS